MFKVSTSYTLVISCASRVAEHSSSKPHPPPHMQSAAPQEIWAVTCMARRSRHSQDTRAALFP